MKYKGESIKEEFFIPHRGRRGRRDPNVIAWRQRRSAISVPEGKMMV
jgi:hypothetical protein